MKIVSVKGKRALRIDKDDHPVQLPHRDSRRLYRASDQRIVIMPPNALRWSGAPGRKVAR